MSLAQRTQRTQRERSFRICFNMTAQRAVQKQKERYRLFAELCKRGSAETRLAAIAVEWATAEAKRGDAPALTDQRVLALNHSTPICLSPHVLKTDVVWYWTE